MRKTNAVIHLETIRMRKRIKLYVKEQTEKGFFVNEILLNYVQDLDKTRAKRYPNGNR